MSKKFYSTLARASVAAFALFAFSPRTFSQTEGAATKPAAAATQDEPKKAAQTDERAEAVLRRAIEALGGAAYLGVKSVVSRGYYTPFAEGVGGLPSTFVDYIVFPDRERTEFKGRGGASIQTFTGDTGWLYEARTRKLSDVTPEQARNFRIAMRTTTDNVLRGWWREEGATLSYVGRREAGLARRNEVVRLSYPDGFVVEFEFGARDNLPSKTRYKKENAEGEQVEEEDRYAQFQLIGGVRTPFIVDHYRAGMQSSRANYEGVEFNRPVPDALFEKPADVKALK
ncbi:MAG TPA: hypothetical protein VFS10_10660 [Pyrinomonadaceae bacterium]|nr:hypothetical protein [Pyrinomonadaceae bacterium]